MADIFAVVADHTRRELLGILLRRRTETLASGDASVSELVAELALSQPTVSKHLKVLREAGLVTVREKGQHRYYRIEPDGLADVGAWVGPFLPAAQTEAASLPGSEPAAASSASTETGGGSALGAAASAGTGPVPGTGLATAVGRFAADVAFRLGRS